MLPVAVGLCLAASAVPPGPAPGADPPPDFKVEAPLRRGGPRVTVRVVGQPATSNWRYDLHVTTADGLDQNVPVRSGQPLTAHDVRLADVNGDGFLDVAVVGGQDHRGAEWVKTWLYDPKGQKYKWVNDA
jgi:hypothetical protein